MCLQRIHTDSTTWLCYAIYVDACCELVTHRVCFSCRWQWGAPSHKAGGEAPPPVCDRNEDSHAFNSLEVHSCTHAMPTHEHSNSECHVQWACAATEILVVSPLLSMAKQSPGKSLSNTGVRVLDFVPMAQMLVLPRAADTVLLKVRSLVLSQVAFHDIVLMVIILGDLCSRFISGSPGGLQDRNAWTGPHTNVLKYTSGQTHGHMCAIMLILSVESAIIWCLQYITVHFYCF